MSTPQYICHNNTCAIAISKATFPSGMNCPVCKEQLKEVLENNQTVQHSNHEQMIVDNYPYVIAYPFSKMLLETHPLAKINLLKDTLQNTLKYVALLLATEYFESQLKSDSINALFKDNLQRPSFGNWNHFIRETLKELHKEDHTFFIKELPEFYKKIEVDGAKKYKIVRKVTNDLGLVENVKSSLTAIEALINFRNKELGHGMTWPDKKNKELYETYYPILRDVLVAMNFVVHYPMYKYDKGSKWELTGTSISIFDTAETVNHKDSKHLWVENKNGEALFLAPFFILPKSYITDVPDEVEVFVYEEYTGSRLIFFSPENAKGETSGAILRELQLLLENKISENAYTKETLNVTLITDQITKQNDRVLKELHTERKVLPGIYQERQNAEVALRSWIGSIYGLFMVSATAGSGKTNLMVEMQNQYEQRNFAAVLLRANRIKSTNIELILKKTLDLDVNYDFNDLKALGFSQNNPLIVLIDGGNEHNTPDAFLQGVLQFLKKHTGGFIKVVLSWRADLKSELPVIEDVYEALVYTEKEDGTQAHLLAKKAYVLTPLNKKELESAWVVYAKDKSKKYKPKFTLEELTYFDRKFTDDLHNPLHLKLFLELFHNKGLPKTKGFFNLWEAYSNQLKKHKEEYTLLLLLIELMFDNQMHALPSALVYEHPSISAYIHNKDISGPYEQLKRKGVLAEYYQDNERYIAFAVEALYHHLLGAFLSEKLIGESNNTLLELISTHQLKGIKEGTQQLLLLDINQQDFSRLLWLIDHADKEQLSYFALPLAQSFIQYEVPSVFEKLFEKPTDNDLFVLSKVIHILETNYSYNNVAHIYNCIHQNIKPTDIKSTFLCVKTISHIDKENRATYLKIIEQSLNVYKKTNLETVKLFKALGYVQRNLLVNQSKALEYFQKALDLGLKILGEKHPNIASSYKNIGSVYSYKNDYDKALDYYRKALAIELQVYGEQNQYTARSYKNIGAVYRAKDDYEKALNYFHKAIAIQQQILGEHHPDIAASYNEMGIVYNSKDDYDKALDYYQKALDIGLNTFGKQHFDTATNYNNTGIVYLSKGDYDKALCFCQKALDIRLLVFGEQHSDVANSYGNIGNVYEAIGDYTKALDYYQNALAIHLQFYGEQHSSVAYCYNNIGGLYNNKGDYDKALNFYQKALRIMLQVYGEQHSDVANSYCYIGNVYEAIGDYTKALDYYQNALVTQLQVHGEQHTSTATTYNNIGLIYLDKGDYGKALDYCKKALVIQLQILGENHPYVGYFYNDIGNIYQSVGNYGRALDYYQKTLAIQLKFYGVQHTSTATTYNNIGSLYNNKGAYDKALDYCKKAVNIRLQFHEEKHPQIAISYKNIGIAYSCKGDYDKALDYYQKALAIQLQVHEGHPQTANFYNNVGFMYFEKENYDKAIGYFKESLSVVIQVFGETHPNTLEVYFHIAQCYLKQQMVKKAIKHFKLWWQHSPEKKGGPAYGLYESYKALNQTKDALHWLEQAALAREDDLGLTHESTQNTITELVVYAKEHDELKMVEQWEQRIREKK